MSLPFKPLIPLAVHKDSYKDIHCSIASSSDKLEA